MFGRLGQIVIRRRALFAVALVAIVGGVSVGAKDVAPDFNITSFFGGEDPAKQTLDGYAAFWGADEATLVVTVTAEGEGILTPARLQKLEAVTEALLALDAVADVAGIATVTRMVGAGGGIELERMVDSVPDDPEERTAWRAAVLGDRLFVPTFISADGAVASLLVELDGDVEDATKVVPLVRAVRGVLAEVEGEAGLSYREAGIPAVRTDFFDVFYADQAIFMPIAVLLILLTLAFVFRTGHGVIVPLVAAFVPLAMLMGVMGFAGEPISIVNQALMTLLPAIAVADAIHMVSRFHEEVRARAAPGERLTPAVRREAIVEALRHIGLACFSTSLTTGIGFASLAMARMPILRNFGLYAALGIVFAYGTVLIIVPLLLSVTRGRVREVGRPGAYTPGDRLLLASARRSIRHRWLVIGAFAAVGAGAGLLSTRVVVDNNLTEMLDEGHRTTEANRTVDRRLGGILVYAVDVAGDPGALKDPAVLAALWDLERWALANTPLRAATSPATFVAEAHRLVMGSAAIPAAPAAAAQLLLLIEANPDLKEIVALDYSRGRLLLRSPDNGGVAFEELAVRLRPEVERRFAGLPVEAELTGMAYVAYRGINHVTVDLRDSLLLAFALIAIVVGFIFRSVRLSVAGLVATALPLVVGYGCLALLGFPLDPTSALVFTLGLGIAIDDSIHILARYREGRRAGESVEAAVESAVLHSGRAVALTSVLIVFAFGINAFSSFPSVSAAGVLGAVMMGAALACDVWLLPALLSLGARPDQPSA